MRVLFCTLEYPPSAAGGAEQQARLQAESLVRRGHRVDVVCARTSSHGSGLIGGVRVHRLSRIQRRYLRTITYLAMLAAFLLLRVRRYDLVHVHLANLQADIAVGIARHNRRPTYVKVAAGGPLGEVGRMRIVSWLTRYYGLRHADAVQAISSEIAADLKSIGIPQESILRIPNGVIVPERPAIEKRVSARADLDLGDEELVVVYAGRMERAKGIADLLAAWRVFSLPSARLLLIGRPGVKQPVSMEHLPPNAEHRRWTDRMDRYLAAADIFVLPSYAEGMSNALLEAMAAGIACISTTVGAAPEMIRNGETGMLITPGDRGALRDALHELASDPERRATIGACARESIAAAYGIEHVVDQVERAYISIAGK